MCDIALFVCGLALEINCKKINNEYYIHFFVNCKNNITFAKLNLFQYMIVTFDKSYLRDLYEYE